MEVSSDSKPGDRVFANEYKGKPDRLLDPEKQIWELVAVDLKVSSDGKAVYKKEELLVEGKTPLTAPTLRKCQIG